MCVQTYSHIIYISNIYSTYIYIYIYMCTFYIHSSINYTNVLLYCMWRNNTKQIMCMGSFRWSPWPLVEYAWSFRHYTNPTLRTCLNNIPSGSFNVAIENGHWNTEFSHQIFLSSIVMFLYQRVCWLKIPSRTFKLHRRLRNTVVSHAALALYVCASPWSKSSNVAMVDVLELNSRSLIVQ